MIYTIENECLRVRVSSMGGELQSIFNKENETEYLWQGDPAIWNERSPNLFPICGRLKDATYTWQGKSYQMKIHGFASVTEMMVYEDAPDRLRVEMVSSDETKKIYPFDFRYELTYSLNGNALCMSYLFENHSSGMLPFSFGAHPGFMVPLAEGESFDDYRIEFETPFCAKMLLFSDAGLYYRETKEIELDEGRILHLSHRLFDKDGSLFLTEMPHSLVMKSKKSGRYVKMEYPDFPYLGLWQMPRVQAPYLCIEPWYGTPATVGIVDDFATKHDMIRLAEGQTHTAQVTITIG